MMHLFGGSHPKQNFLPPKSYTITLLNFLTFRPNGITCLGPLFRSNTLGSKLQLHSVLLLNLGTCITFEASTTERLPSCFCRTLV